MARNVLWESNAMTMEHGLSCAAYVAAVAVLAATGGTGWAAEGAREAAAAPAAAGRGGAASFAEFDRRARAGGERLNVVFFGGSLTWGANASDPQRTSYRGRMGEYLRGKYPKAPLVFHDAAIGGTGSKLGIFRLERDVLGRKPDLVFLDFTVNDGQDANDLPTLGTYECLLREMIGRGIPVVQVMLPFMWNYMPRLNPKAFPRYLDHLKLSAAYHTGVADAFAYVQTQLDAKKATLKDMWPVDGVHPCDRGYEVFFEAARIGYEKALADQLVCALPAKPVFGKLIATRRRIRLVDGALPAGWKRQLTYRTSMWFDGLSSRWMDDVAVCDAKDKASVQPIRMEFDGTLLGIFGEADENGLDIQVLVDGQVVKYQANPKAAPRDTWPFSTKPFGQGRLFIWRVIAADLPPGRHTVEIRPVFGPEGTKGQLRIESICVAGR